MVKWSSSMGRDGGDEEESWSRHLIQCDGRQHRTRREDEIGVSCVMSHELCHVVDAADDDESS